jgi:hypothetical protein
VRPAPPDRPPPDFESHFEKFIHSLTRLAENRRRNNPSVSEKHAIHTHLDSNDQEIQPAHACGKKTPLQFRLRGHGVAQSRKASRNCSG